MERFGLNLIVAVSVAMGACLPNVALTHGKDASVDWPGHGGTSDETDYSELAQINRENVQRLGLAWYLDLPDERMLQSTPVEVNGVIYSTGSYAKVYAADAVSGKLLWTYDPEAWKHGPQKLRFALPSNRGVGYGAGRVFVGTIDGRLIALDAKTGKVLWTVETTAADSKQTITGAPRVFNGKVVIGNGGADFGERGYLTAYEAATGKQVWRFYVAPGSPEENKGDPAMEQAAATWRGEFWKTGTGGGPWDGITFDKDLNRIYLGTGNASPFDPEARSPGGGDNLYTAAMVALDADTGKYVWHYQLNPRDAWDFDATQQIALADLNIDGQQRKVLMQAAKNGFVYVIDRLTGKVISAGKEGKVTWADGIDLVTGRPIERPDIRYQGAPVTVWPSPLGAHNYHAMSFSPQTGLLYIPYMQLGMRYAKGVGTGKNVSMVDVSMSTVEVDAEDHKGALVAYDPVAQKERWKVQHDFFWNGGTLATGGGLVFQGTADGYFNAYDASSGAQAWRFNAGLGIVAAPVSFSVRGTQYVSVVVGYGGSNSAGNLMNAGWKYGAQTRRLLTFRLDAKAALPPMHPADFTIHPADDNPTEKIDTEAAARGERTFSVNCGGCHGLAVISAGAPAPDLRESRAALEPKVLFSIVHDGALLPRGMPRFDKLDTAQIEEISAYIRLKQRAALNGDSSKPDSSGRVM